jgi:hypothetical protein
MLTDTKLRNLKPQDKLYKVNDRDGLYVAVTPAGSISFRYNYSISGRQETLTFGRYGVGGITLSEARAAERSEEDGRGWEVTREGESPRQGARERRRDVRRLGREVAARLPDGGLYARHAPVDLRARLEGEIREPEAHRNHA